MLKAQNQTTKNVQPNQIIEKFKQVEADKISHRAILPMNWLESTSTDVCKKLHRNIWWKSKNNSKRSTFRIIFNKGQIYIKSVNNNKKPLYDITMGIKHGAEVCEVVGLYIIYKFWSECTFLNIQQKYIDKDCIFYMKGKYWHFRLSTSYIISL